jgi:hypothetical protein
MLSTAGNQMVLVALGWQMYDLTASAWDLGLVGLAQFVPTLLFTIPAGQLADAWIAASCSRSPSWCSSSPRRCSHGGAPRDSSIAT